MTAVNKHCGIYNIYSTFVLLHAIESVRPHESSCTAQYVSRIELNYPLHASLCSQSSSKRKKTLRSPPLVHHRYCCPHFATASWRMICYWASQRWYIPILDRENGKSNPKKKKKRPIPFKTLIAGWSELALSLPGATLCQTYSPCLP